MLPDLDNNLTPFEVCKSFFVKTLAISDKRLRNIAEKKRTDILFRDRRGRKEPGNKMQDMKMKKVKAHINSFPTVGPHYVRKSSTRRYLDAQLNKKEMYQLYCKQEEDSVSETTYRRQLKLQNISFHKPKKDRCARCESYTLNTARMEEDEIKQKCHIALKEAAQQEKSLDKEKALNDPPIY